MIRKNIYILTDIVTSYICNGKNYDDPLQKGKQLIYKKKCRYLNDSFIFEDALGMNYIFSMDIIKRKMKCIGPRPKILKKKKIETNGNKYHEKK